MKIATVLAAAAVAAALLPARAFCQEPANLVRLKKMVARIEAAADEIDRLSQSGTRMIKSTAGADLSAQRDVVEQDKTALADIEARLSSGAATGSVKQCLSSFNVDKMLAGYGKQWNDEDILKSRQTDGGGLSNLLSYLAFYQTANALRAGDPGRCAGPSLISKPNKAWEPLYSQGTIADACVEFYWYAQLAKAFVSKGPELQRVCMTRALLGGVKPQDPSKPCAVMVQYADKPRTLVAKLVAFDPSLVTPAKQARTIKHFMALAGQASEAACGEFPQWEILEREKCLATIRYRKAATTGNPAACGSSGLCLAMLGRPGADAYVKTMSRLFCEGVGYKSEPTSAGVEALLKEKTLIVKKLQRDSETLAAKVASLHDREIEDPAEKQVRDLYAAKLKELRLMLDEAMQAMAGYEPKSDPRYADEVEALREQQQRFNELQRRASSRLKTTASRGKTKPEEPAPKPKR